MGKKYKSKGCSICGKVYNPTSPKQKYCLECQKVKAREWGRATRRKIKGYENKQRNCLVCGKEFDTYYDKKRYCGSPECELERQRVKSQRAEVKRKIKRKDESRLQTPLNNNNVSIDNIGKEQDSYILSIGKGNEIWCCESNLRYILKDLFPDEQVESNKYIVIEGKKWCPDYSVESLKLVVEFQGYRHFSDSKVVYSDKIKRDSFLMAGWFFIEIPFFVQPTLSVVSYLFGNIAKKELFKDFSRGFPHGFIHPKAMPIGNFCYSGLLRAKKIFLSFPGEVMNQCFASLLKRSELIGVPIEVLNPLYEYEI